MFNLADFHCDTITRLKDLNQNIYQNTGHIDIKRLKTFDSAIISFAICLDGRGKNCFSETIDYIECFLRELKSNKEDISLAKNYSDIMQNKEDKKISAILAIEGGEALEGNIKNLKPLYDLGVRIFTLTWNHKNELGNGVLEASKDGLTNFGCEVVKELEKYGIIIDVSHLNEKGFWDVANLIDTAFVASHSNCRKLCDNPRNLTDMQIAEIAKHNGLIGMNLFPEFINDSKTAVLLDIMAHIEHVINIAGVDKVCFGSDFDGVRYLPSDVENILAFHKLREALLLKYSAEEVEKIFYGNLLRTIKNILV